MEKAVESSSAVRARKWVIRAMRGAWRKRAFTLTFLTVEGHTESSGATIEKLSRLRFTFGCDGADGPMFLPSQNAIILHRADFHKLLEYALSHAPLRDYCMIRVPSKCGLRPGEVRMLKWENIDCDALLLNFTDSKKQALFSVPMDPLTADFLKQLQCQTHHSKWVFEHMRQGQWQHWVNSPLSPDMLDHIVKTLARSAGCQAWRKMNMYLLRHFFAASWAYPGNGKQPGNLHALSRILRHKSLTCTQIYLSRLTWFEDVQAEYNRLQGGALAGFSPKPNGSAECVALCNDCIHEATCRFRDQVVGSSWASGCRFKVKAEKKEVV